MSDDKPLLHGREFGGEVDGKVWVGRFLFMGNNVWAFVFLDEEGKPYWDISGTGSTPRSAFDDCVQVFIGLNEGVESPTLRYLLPRLDEYFNDDGSVKLAQFLV